MYLALFLLAASAAPQMTLQGGAQNVACGDTAKISLQGRFPNGTKVTVRRDDAELDDVKLTPTSLSATLKLAKTALPGPVTLDALSAGNRASLVIANVNEKLRLSLQFEDGWIAALSEAQAGFYDVVWSKGTATRESHAQIAPTDGGLRINFQMSAEQQKLEQERVDAVQARFKDPEFKAAQQRFEDCQKLAKEEQKACLMKASAQSQTVREKLRKEDEQRSAALKAREPKEAWGCLQAIVHGHGGQLEGVGHCVFKEMKVTAKVECLGR
ncbi:MAG TPA: hypothetical protein VGH20_00900 [Myxococcales bacterium]|jgi:hypothetical protein